MVFHLFELLWRGEGPEFGQPVLAAVQLGLVVVFHLVDHAHVQVHLRHLSLAVRQLTPPLLSLPSPLAALQDTRRHLALQQLVLVQRHCQPVRSLEPHSPDLFLNYAQIHENCGRDCALVADIEHGLRWHSLLGAEKRVPLLAPPNRYLLGAYGVVAVLQIEHLPFGGAQDSTASGDGLALVEPARRLHPEYLGSHGLHAGNAGSSSHQLDRVEGNRAVPGLKGRHGRSDVCQHRHNDHLHFLALHAVGEVFLVEEVLQAELVIVIGGEDRALPLHRVHQLRHRLPVLQQRLLLLSLELRTVELAHETVHVAAASKRQVLPVQQPPLETRELHQIYRHLRVPDVQEDHVPHLLQTSQLFQPVVGVLRGQGSPLIHQTHRFPERQLSATQQGRSFLVGEVSGDCDVSDSQGQVVTLDDAFGLAQQTQQHLFDSHCHSALPPLHQKHQILAALVLHFLVLHLLGKQVGVVADPQEPLWRANGVLEVGFQFDDCRLSDEPLSGGVADERGRLSEVGLVGEHLQLLAVEGAQLEAPGADVHAHYHCAWLHRYHYTTTHKTALHTHKTTENPHKNNGSPSLDWDEGKVNNIACVAKIQTSTKRSFSLSVNAKS